MEAGWGQHKQRKIQRLQTSCSRKPVRIAFESSRHAREPFYSPFLPKLIEDLEGIQRLADAGYDSKTNYRAVKDIDAEPVIASNPKRGKRKKIKHAQLLKNRRYVVEQFNGHIKANVLKQCWIRPRGSG